MRAIILVYQLQEDEYPTLTSVPKERLEFFLREGYFVVDSPYDVIPNEESTIDHPVDVLIVG